MKRYWLYLTPFIVTLLVFFPSVKAYACFFCPSSDGKADGGNPFVIGLVIGAGVLYLLRRITKK